MPTPVNQAREQAAETAIFHSSSATTHYRTLWPFAAWNVLHRNLKLLFRAINSAIVRQIAS
ncbi:MAG: hypothetical protein M3Y57_12495, partial [Acidobacteriota bacterium]|nr:hypothetical protein [Acidobacteriota bacterium]